MILLKSKLTQTLFFIFCSIISAVSGYAQTENLKFNYLTLKEGLPSAIVNTILQDYQGFMWFGTEDGLYKYDGYNFTSYLHNLADTGSIVDNNISGIIEDQKQRLWISTFSGVDLFDKNSNSFSHIPLIEEQIVGGDTIRIYRKRYYTSNIFQDANGEIYIGTRKTLLYKLDLEKRCIRPFASKITFNDNVVRSSDKRGNIWISSQAGAYKFNTQTQKVEHLTYNVGDLNGLASNRVFTIHVDHDDNVWIATDKALHKIDGRTQQIKRYLSSENATSSIANYYISQIYEDKYHNLWFCTEKGLCKYNKNNDDFIRYTPNNSGLNSLRSNKTKCVYVNKQGVLWTGLSNVGVGFATIDNSYKFNNQNLKGQLGDVVENDAITAIFKDRDGFLWIGTDGGELYQFDKFRTSHRSFKYSNKRPESVSANAIMCISQDTEGDIWIGSYYGGLSRFDRVKESFTTYNLDSRKETDIGDGSNDVRGIVDDGEGNLILATCGDGLVVFNKHTKQFKYYYHSVIDSNSIVSNYCLSILQDSNNLIWVGTYNGLSCWDMERNVFTNYFHDEQQQIIYSLLEDSRKNIWIGTTKGLFLRNPNATDFIHFSCKDGLPNDVINGILEDTNKNIWLSTNNGISNYNYTKNSFKNYDVSHGLQGNMFMHGSAFGDKYGELFFGGTDGYTSFKANDIQINTQAPLLYITDLSLMGNSEKAEDNEMFLSFPISDTKYIDLDFNQSSFTIRYVALNYLNLGKIQYAHYMEGFDKEWQHSNNELIATYSNLEPGEYTFRVKACNSDGYCNETQPAIHFTISPPLSRTNSAYVLYFLLFMAILYGILRALRYRDFINNQLQIERIEAAKQHEVDVIRMRLFTNISHEFRTPLSLILGQSERIADNIRNKIPTQPESVQSIIRNAKQLLKLVNQILDLRKIESGTERFQPTPTEIVPFVNDLYKQFQLQAVSNGINYTIHLPVEPIVVSIDQDKIEKVISNLLSNAIKYTPSKGSISLTVSIIEGLDSQDNFDQKTANDQSILKIEVSDTGFGIPENEKDMIFDPFYQTYSKSHQNICGTGIGLSIVKEYVQMHQGKIHVYSNSCYHSEFKSGTSFVVELPIRDFIGNSNLAETTLKTVSFIGEQLTSTEAIEMTMRPTMDPNIESSLPVVLIIEDNTELRDFLKSELSTHYQVLDSSNGTAGLSITFSEIPDLIVSDVMMDDMSGFDLCNIIKSDMRTSHIPVILLTALASDANYIEGLKKGADDYLTKPFNVNILLLRIRNLIDTRKQLQEKFSKRFDPTFEPLANSSEDIFMEKIKEYMQQNLENPEIDIEDITKNLGFSRTQLYKKIRAISGQTVFGLIISFRLNKAAEIILTEDVSISEVATRVGFSSLSVFTRSFTRQFNVNPSKYAQAIRSNK